MALLLSITQGWTKRLGPFTLKNNGVALDLTGMGVRLILRGRGSTVLIPPSAQITVDPDQVANTGEVYYKPLASDFRSDKSPYTVHWELTDGAGDVVFVPNGDPDTIEIAAQ